MAEVVRIQGLVRLADQVRGEIGRGVSGGRKVQLRTIVTGAVGQVDSILARRGARVAHLAAPSRKAYQFLADIRWDEVQEAAAGEAGRGAPDGAVRWKGLGASLERFVRRLAGDVGDAELGEIHRAIEAASRRMENTIQREGITAGQLTAQTRELRGWFAWMAERANVAAYRGAVGLARGALVARAPAGSPPIEVEFRPIRHIFKMRTQGGRRRVTLPTAMVRFDAGAFADVATLAFGRDREAKQRIVARMRGEAYLDLVTELESLGGVVERTKGAFFDLAEVFERVNGRFFGGTLGRPRLTWSRGMTSRKMGHYDHVRDLVMVSSTLDQAVVPAFVVDYLMFHELLHKKHGVRWVNGRGYAHTAAFYAEERRFERYDEADAWLTRLARS